MTQGYYRFPTICRDTIVFVSEDDLWTVPRTGGIARPEHLEPRHDDLKELGVGRHLDDIAVAVGLLLPLVQHFDEELVERVLKLLSLVSAWTVRGD